MNTESVQMSTTHWWEISYPMPGIFKALDVLLGNIHHSQQIVLEFCWLYSLGELWWISVCLQFICQLYGSRANGHSCTMETEWEQYIVSV